MRPSMWSAIRNMFKLTTLLLFVGVGSTLGQNLPVSGWCEQGGQNVTVSGSLQSTSQVQSSYPGCSVTVYQTGTLNKAVIYNSSGSPITNPFNASVSTGQWTFYVSTGVYDVYLSGGSNGGIPTPYTTSINVGGAGSGSGVNSVTASTPLTSSGGSNPNVTIETPLPVPYGGTGTTTPALVQGTGIGITGTWPNQTVTNTGVTSVVGGGTVTCTTIGTAVSCVGSGSGGGGNSILATDPSIGWQCSPISSPNYSLINSNTIIAATNAWVKSNPNGYLVFPSNSYCIAVGQTSTSSIVVNTMLLGATSTHIIGDNTVMIVTTEAGANNVNFQTGQSDFNCFSGSVTAPTINYDFTAAPIATVAAGSSTVTATGFTGVAGDTVLVYGFDQQGGGFPPNYRYFERKTVQLVTGTGTQTITFDSPLNYSYNSAWPYNNAVNTTPPSVRDLSQTCVGGGTVQRPHYVYVQGFDFSQTIPSQSGQIPTVYAGGADYSEFVNTKFGYFSPEGGGTIVVRDSSYQWIELDKLNSNFYSYNTKVTGNVQTPSDSCVVSGSGTLYTRFDSSTFDCQVSQASRRSIYDASVFYSQTSAPYGFFSNGSAGYQNSVEVNSPILYENGVSQSGIYSANNGYNVVVSTVPTSSTFTTSSPLAVQQYVGPGTRFYDHISGAYIGQSTQDPTLVSGAVTVTGTFLGGNAATMTLNSCSGCSGFVTGDTWTIVQSGATGAQFTVTATAGVPTTITRLTGGTLYSVATGLSTVRLTGSGVGTLLVNIGSIQGNPVVSQSIDINTNAQYVKVRNPVAMDFDINSIPPAFDGGLTALIPSFSMEYPPSTTIADLGPCNAASSYATKWVNNAASQSNISSTGTSIAPVFCSGVNQFSGIWNPVSQITSPYLDGILTARSNAVLNAGIYSLTLTGSQQPSTSGNGTFPPPIQVLGAQGQNTTGTTGQSAGGGQNIIMQPGQGGNAGTGSSNGYSGYIEFDSNVGGSGTGSAGGVSYVGIGNVVAAPSKIGGAGGANCFGTISLIGTCGNGLYNQYFSGNELHTGIVTVQGGILNTSNLNSSLYTTVASAGTITPTGLVNKITGSTPINQINSVSGAGGSGQIASIALLADPAGTGFNLTSGSNVYLPGGASTYTVNKGQIVDLKYDSTSLTWYCLGCGGSGSGSLPTSLAQQFYTTNSSNVAVSQPAGPIGALQVLANGQPEIVTTVVPILSYANSFTGRQRFTVNPIDLSELSSAPTNPASGFLSMYADNSGVLHTLSPSGVNTSLGSGSVGVIWESSSYATVALATACSAINTNYSFTAITIPANTLSVGNRVKLTYQMYFLTSTAISTALVSPLVTFGAAGTTGHFYDLTSSNANAGSNVEIQDDWFVATSSSELQAIKIFLNNSAQGYNLGGNGTGTGVDGSDAITGAINVAPGLSCGSNVSGLAGSVSVRYQVEVWK